MKPLPLRTSLTLVYTSLLALLVTGVAVGYHRLLIRQIERDATASLEELVRGLHGYVQFREGQPAFVYDTHDPDASAFIEEATRYYQVFDAATGRLLVQSRAFDAAGVDYTPAEVSVFREQRSVHDVQTDQGRVRISSTIIAPAPGQDYLLQVGLPLDRVDRSVAGLERQVWWGIALGLAASAVLGRWMAGRALAPLSRLAEAARPIDITTLDRRLPLRGTGDELDDVTLAFNHALARVERAVGDMRQFSAALAHELRTPLAVLRGETELALRTVQTPEQARLRLESQIEEFDRLNGLITQILTLARAESGQINLARDPIDLSALSHTIVEQMAPIGDARGISVTCRASSDLIVTGDAGWLQRLLLILLDNAIKFTPDNGQVTVDLSSEPGFARLTVTDTGVGMSAEVLPHVFERFYRADPARTRRIDGAGLGLALAKWIAEQHHATIAVSSRPDHGSHFTVRIPAAPTTRDTLPTIHGSREAAGPTPHISQT